ncbi:hypothetical protein ACF8EF_16990 [Pseudomonas sp. zjy_15]
MSQSFTTRIDEPWAVYSK